MEYAPRPAVRQLPAIAPRPPAQGSGSRLAALPIVPAEPLVTLARIARRAVDCRVARCVQPSATVLSMRRDTQQREDAGPLTPGGFG